VKVSTTVTLEVEYDAPTKRYRASVLQEGKVLYTAVRAKKESAIHNAQQYIAYQVTP
jgi:hypothetical protein